MTWAHYILQVNIYLVVFYGFYKLLLDKETYFLLNRIYLVTAGILSLAIPFLRFEWFSMQPAVQPVYTGVVQMNDFITMSVVHDSPNLFNISNMLVLIYLAGMLFFVTKFIVQLISVQILLKKSKSGSAFSFFRKKVVDENLPEVQTIQKHEEIHIRQWHTLDVIFFELLGIITWFNPVIYFYKKTIKNIHEYLADEAAANYQGDKEQYALLLLSSAFGIEANSLTNSFFNKSLIKKRIYMLHKQRSRKTAILKYGLFVPLFAVTLIMSSATIRKNEKIQQVTEGIVLEQPLNIVREAVTEAITSPVKTPGEINNSSKNPTITTNTSDNIEAIDWKDFYDHIKRMIRYPVAAQESNIQGYTQIKFIVKDGEAEEVSTATALGSGCDAEVMRAILSYSKFKNIPNGKYTFNTQFKLSYESNTHSPTSLKNQNLPVVKGYITLPEIVVVGFGLESSSKNSGNSKVYDFVSLEKGPSFPGGMQEFYKYLGKAVKYPKEAQNNNIQGKVFLSFIVETDGELTDIRVDRSVGYGIDEEAVRIIKESPKWIPGMQGGQKVRTKYNIPINFTLSEPAPAVEGKVGGIQIRDNKIMIDGVKSDKFPLYIVDGEKIDKSELPNMDPNQIASIEVLKDKSATALYGDAGKDGVVKITTKVKQATDLKKKEAKEKKN